MTTSFLVREVEKTALRIYSCYATNIIKRRVIEKNMKLKVKEKDVLRAITDYLTLKKIYWIRVNSGAIRTERSFIKLARAGTPDIVVCHKGRFVGIECKAGKNKQTTDQVHEMREIILSGGDYYVMRSIDDLQKFMHI